MPLSPSPQSAVGGQRGSEILELSTSLPSYRQLFDANPQPMWVYDMETLRFLAVNDAAVAHYGYTREEFLAMRITDIRSAEEAARLMQRIAVVREQDVRNAGVWQHRRKNGTTFEVEVMAHTLEFGDRRAQLVHVNDVTERLRTERKLRESEARFRGLAEMSSDWYWETDSEHRFTLRSSGSKDRFVSALLPDARLGLRRWEIPYLAPDEAGWRAHRAVLDAHLPFRDFELTRLGDDGSARYVLISGDPVFDPSRGFQGYRGIGTDVTERKHAQMELERRKDLYNLLSQTNQAIVRLGNRDALFPVICRNAVEYGRFVFAWIGAVSAEDRRVRPVAQYGEDAGYVDALRSPQQPTDQAQWSGPLGQALRAGEHVISNDFLNDPLAAAWHEAARRAGVRSAAAFPIREHDAVVGVLCLYAADSGYFTEDLIATLDEMALDVSFGLTVYAREAERKEREEELRRFRAAMDATEDGIYVVDRASLSFIDVNAGACAMLGLTREQILAAGPEGVLALSREDLARLYDSVIATGGSTQPVEMPRTRSDGRQVWIEVRRHPQRSETGWTIVTVASDITERKYAEGSLHESEVRFRSLTEMSSDFYCESDTEHRLTQRDSANRKLSTVSVFEKGAQIGERRWEIPYLSPDAAGWHAHQATLDAHLPFRNFELSRPGVDGTERFISISGDPVFDASGGFKGYRGVGTDVTERKREEQLLRLEHAIARCLTEASDQSSALKMVMRIVCESLQWGIGRYWRVDEAANVLRFGEFWRAPGSEFERFTDGSRDVTFAPGTGLVGRVWQSGEPIWVADFGADPRVVQKDLARATGMRGTLAFPVVSGGRTLGVLAFLSRLVREPDQRLLAATRVIGSEVGQFIRRKQVEEQLQALNAELEQRVAERTQALEVANKELEAFSYSVSHDLRAPLRAIHGFSSLLREQYARQIDEQGRDMLRRVSAGTEKMGQLIDDLLKLSRVSRQEMKVEPVDLSEMAWEVIGELQAEAPERRVEWVIAPQVAAMGDAGLLRVVLQNLIGNAWKYSSKREHARVEFGVAERYGRPAYFVRDNGAGFDMAQAKKLFGAFQRLHSTAEFPGSGIGLATVSRVIHRHGGEVWAEARAGEGASFCFSLARIGGGGSSSASAARSKNASDGL